MTQIISKRELREKLNNVLSVEKSARNSYEEDLGIFSDEKIKKEISKIKDDEIHHISILNELIEMLKE